MGRLLDVAKAVRADAPAPSAGERESEPLTRTPSVTPAPERRAASEPSRPNTKRESAQRFGAAVEPVGDPLAGIVLPTRRCQACNSWLYWVSVYGAVVCVTCHPPANRDLVKTWYWLPEGECKKTQ
jgi:hypothetical protein